MKSCLVRFQAFNRAAVRGLATIIFAPLVVLGLAGLAFLYVAGSPFWLPLWLWEAFHAERRTGAADGQSAFDRGTGRASLLEEDGDES